MGIEGSSSLTFFPWMGFTGTPLRVGDTTTAPVVALGRDAPALLVWLLLFEEGMRALLLVLGAAERGDGALTLINAMLLLFRLLLRRTEMGVPAASTTFFSRGVDAELLT